MQLGTYPLDGIDLHDDLAIEVVTDVQIEIRMRRPCEAVVTDDAVGDEVAGTRRDVVHRDLDAERLDGNDA